MGTLQDDIIPMDDFEMVKIDKLYEEIKKIAIHKSSGIHNIVCCENVL